MTTIAITGHTAGIGKAFAERFSADGHTVVGLSKREGHNIRNIPKIANHIIQCDMWINNAQAGYAQTELLFEVAKHWKNQGPKMIWTIGTMMTEEQKLPEITGLTSFEIAEYRTQKRALNDAIKTVRSIAPNIKHVIIRPGNVATQPQWPNGANVNEWANFIVDSWIESRKYNLFLSEMSVGYHVEDIPLDL